MHVSTLFSQPTTCPTVLACTKLPCPAHNSPVLHTLPWPAHNCPALHTPALACTQLPCPAHNCKSLGSPVHRCMLSCCDQVAATAPTAGPSVDALVALPPLYVTSSGALFLDQTQLQLTTTGALTSGSIGRGFGRCCCSVCCCVSNLVGACCVCLLQPVRGARKGRGGRRCSLPCVESNRGRRWGGGLGDAATGVLSVLRPQLSGRLGCGQGEDEEMYGEL